jgi:hypothetical protein
MTVPRQPSSSKLEPSLIRLRSHVPVFAGFHLYLPWPESPFKAGLSCGLAVRDWYQFQIEVDVEPARLTLTFAELKQSDG